MSIKRLVADNQALIAQLIDTLDALPTIKDLWSTPEQTLQVGSVGAHCRHIFEHYQLLLDNLSLSHINYDNRARNSQFEQSWTTAKAIMTNLYQQLEQLGNTDSSLQVALSTNSCQPACIARSSLSRELQFVHSHTTHHMALIGVLLRLNGLTVSSEFGKASSTQKYQCSQQQVG